MQNEERVEMVSLFGPRILVPRSKLRLRVSVYGIFFDSGEVLTVPHKLSGKLGFPGGAIDSGEDLGTALKRECFEEIGTDNIKIGRLVGCLANLFYYNPPNMEPEFMDARMNFYLCEVNREDVVDSNDEIEGPPTWYKVSELKDSHFNELISGSFLDIIRMAQAV